MKQQRLLIVLIIALLTSAITFLNIMPLQLGLDLKGGSQLTIQLKPTEDIKNISQEDLEAAKTVLENRVNGLGVAEPIVQTLGKDKIVIQLPGVTNPEQAERVLGGTAQLDFQEQRKGTEGQLSAEFKIRQQKNIELNTIMAKKYVNFRVGGVPERKDEDYTVWTNDLLSKLIASKTVDDPCRSTYGHRLLESEVVYVVISGRGTMEIVEYTNTEEGHGHDPSHGIMHKDEYALAAGDVILAEEGDYVKVINESDHDQLVYLRIFDKAGWRGRSPDIDKDPQSK